MSLSPCNAENLFEDISTKISLDNRKNLAFHGLQERAEVLST